MSVGEGSVRVRAEELTQRVAVLRQELAGVIIGQPRLLDDLLCAILCGGHVLLEGLPGLGKTLLVKSLAQCLGLEFARIQFTPDLMPADVTGTTVFEEKGGHREFRFQRGPVFTNLLLADEINRATPKTQSALLEAMQEAAVTIQRETHALPEPFLVVATQNPIELEGTFPLPEAQLDRFLFKLIVTTPAIDDMVRILGSTTGADREPPRRVMAGPELIEFGRIARDVLCAEHQLRFVAEVLRATHPGPDASDDTSRLVRFGASPRAGQAVVLAAKVTALLDGRSHVERDDLLAALAPALRHRVVLSFEAEAERTSVDDLIPAWVEAASRRSD